MFVIKNRHRGRPVNKRRIDGEHDRHGRGLKSTRVISMQI